LRWCDRSGGLRGALHRQNYADYQRYTCNAVLGTEGAFVAAQQDSVRQHGAAMSTTSPTSRSTVIVSPAPWSTTMKML
jgi:hypothetical protein